MRLWAWLLAITLPVTGCYDAHGLVGDAAVADGGGFDSAARPYDAAACPEIAGYPRCGEGCGGPWCNRGGALYCDRDLTICTPGYDEFRGLDGCDMFPDGDDPPMPGARVRYCWSGHVCAAPRRDVAATDGGISGFDGRCVDEGYCDEVGGHIEGIACLWSDLSERAAGAPEESVCPPADPRSPFCGRPCGDCPWVEPPRLLERSFNVSCVGISDRRGLGVCAVNSARPCRDGASASILCGNHFEEDLLSVFGGEPCACLMLEDPSAPGTFHEWGWATLAESCHRYREQYPDQVRCLEEGAGEP